MDSSKSKNLTWTPGHVSDQQREALLNQRGCVVWLTGLSGSGKSTIARELEWRLIQDGHPACVLDGDNVRHGLNSDLGFSPEDRAENIRRVGHVAALMAQAGLICISAFISPYRAGRERARQAAGEGRFLEVYLDIPVEQCEKRDPKGLYAKARNGEISDFTGIDAPYESPESPEIRIQTDRCDVHAAVDMIMQSLRDKRFLSVTNTK